MAKTDTTSVATASLSYSTEVDKAIKRFDPAVLSVNLKIVPRVICVGEKLDLSKWCLILTDENLDFISSEISLKSDYFYIDSSEPSLSHMFKTFWVPRKASNGLTSLKVAGAKNISDAGVSKVARRCRNLKELDISGCPDIGDVTLRELGLYSSKLEILTMSSCHSIEGAGLVSVAENCSNLMKLNISRCKNLQRWAISKLFYECKKLEEVDISCMGFISDEEIRVLSQNNPRLLTLIAYDCPNISDTGILSLSQFCPDLDYLDLSRHEMAFRITDVGLLALGQRSSSLRILKLNGCEHITDVGLSWLADGCRALEEIDIGGCGKVSGISACNF